jgi:hypothetical protein
LTGRDIFFSGGPMAITKILKKLNEINTIVDDLEISEMAFSRYDWVRKLSDYYFGGALGEYAKLYIARKTETPDFWSNEVTSILNRADKYIRGVKIKTKFDKDLAITEAMLEASLMQPQITSAKNEMVKIYPEFLKKIKTLNMPSENIFDMMIKEYMSKYSKYLE